MSETAKITVHPSFKIGEISPRLFSTFLEPIGTMVNGTMYNPKHPTADEQGFRTDFIGGLKGNACLPLAGRKFCIRMAVEGFHWPQGAEKGSPGSRMVSVHPQ